MKFALLHYMAVSQLIYKNGFPPLSFSGLYAVCSCACKQYHNLKGPLSNRKHWYWDASSAALPIVLWLCHITLRHHVTHLQELCQAASLARKDRFGTAALLLSLCWVRRVWADQLEPTGYSGQGVLKGTGAKTWHFRKRGNRTVWENWHVFEH